MERNIFNSIFIKEKQWYRTGRNHINQIFGSSGKYSDNYGIKNIANTPQELIEVGDLVRDNRGILIEIDTIYYNSTLETYFVYDTEELYEICIDNIVEILTPNSNGGYDLQWEANNGTK